MQHTRILLLSVSLMMTLILLMITVSIIRNRRMISLLILSKFKQITFYPLKSSKNYSFSDDFRLNKS